MATALSAPFTLHADVSHEGPRGDAASAPSRLVVRTFRQVASVRGQAAVARTLLHELERAVPASRMEGTVTTQLVEDLARLGCKLLEAAAALGEAIEAELAAREPPAALVHRAVRESPEVVVRPAYLRAADPEPLGEATSEGRRRLGKVRV